MTNDRLGPRARLMIDAARSAEPALDEASAARMRGRLLGAIAAAAITTTAAAATTAATATEAGGAGGAVASSAALGVTTKVVALCVLIGVLGGGGLALFGGARGTPTAAPVITTPLAFTPPSSVSAGPSTPSLGDVPVRSVDDLPSMASEDQVQVGGGRAVPSTVPRVAVVPAATPSASGSALDGEAFAREVESLDRARKALAAGDASAAIKETETAPRSGAFAEDRAALRVVALCMAGRRSEGNLQLARFRRAFPRSIHTERAERACIDPEVTDSPASGHSSY